MPVYDKEGNILGIDDIITQLRDHVVPNSELRINRPVNLLTAGDRREWAEVYERIESKYCYLYNYIIIVNVESFKYYCRNILKNYDFKEGILHRLRVMKNPYSFSLSIPR